MYQNLINSLKKILDSKATQAEKLLKISTLVDFADGLESPIRVPSVPPIQPYPLDMNKVTSNPVERITTTFDTKKPNSPGAIVGVEDVK